MEITQFTLSDEGLEADILVRLLQLFVAIGGEVAHSRLLAVVQLLVMFRWWQRVVVKTLLEIILQLTLMILELKLV